MTTHAIGTVVIGGLDEFGPRFATEARLGGLCFGIHSIETAMTRDDAQAACRLANAAPEMLAALEHLRTIAATAILHRTSLDHQGLIELFEEAREAAFAAIAKATGP